MKKSYLLGLCGLLAMGAFSCKDDAISSSPDDVVEATTGVGYVSFNIKTDLSTRDAGDVKDESGETFNPGTADEYAMAPASGAHLALYFDKEGKYFGSSNLQKYDGPTDGTGTSGTEKIYSYVNKYRYADALSADYVLLLLNFEPSVLSSIQSKVEQVKTNAIAAALQIISSEENPGYYTMENTKYFSMSSSLYFSNTEDRTDEVETTTDVSNKIAAPISSKLYETIEDALDQPMTVHVERVLAKHQITFQASSVDGSENRTFTPNKEDKSYKAVNYIANYPYGSDNTLLAEDKLDFPDTESKDWKVYIEGWDLNALETSTFYFKNVNNDASSSLTYPWNINDATIEYPASSTVFFPDWNFDALHRSYWAVDPHYLAGGNFNFPGVSAYNYPTQYRDYSQDPDGYENIGVEGLGSVVGSDGSVANTSLKYISYADIDKNAGNIKYSLENTYADDLGLKGYGPYRYATHILLAARLLLDDETAANAADKYHAYDLWFGDAASYIRFAYRRMMRAYADGERQQTLDGESFVAEDEALYVKETNGYTKIDFTNADKYFDLGDANIVHGDGRQVLVPKDGITYALNITTVDASGSQDVSTTAYKNLTAEQLQTIIYENTESVQHFKEGRMYYAVPVQHKKGKTEGDMVSISKNGTYALGQFGVVRNHWYRFNIEAIQSIGTPVDNPDQPIIPDPEDEYYIAFDIRILPWHIINNGNVTLK